LDKGKLSKSMIQGEDKYYFSRRDIQKWVDGHPNGQRKG
jgi:hypothetical protein